MPIEYNDHILLPNADTNRLDCNAPKLIACVADGLRLSRFRAATIGEQLPLRLLQCLRKGKTASRR